MEMEALMAGCGDDVSCSEGLAYAHAGAISVNSPISNHPSTLQNVG
jgi:hypothetical protein